MHDRQRLIDRAFHDWTDGKDPVAARVSVFEQVRDIPYAVLPKLIDAVRYTDILKTGRGSCTPKHFLMAEMFRRMGLLTLFAIYPFRWGKRSDIIENYPQHLKELADRQPTCYHVACKVEIDGRLVLVDATLDIALAKLEILPVNRHWDGFSDTLLPMTPTGDEVILHPSEAHLIKPVVTPQALQFYDFLNTRMQDVREGRVVGGQLPEA